MARRSKRAQAILSGSAARLAAIDAANPDKIPTPSDPLVSVLRDGEIVIQSPSERIPDHVWRKLAKSGDSAVTRLEAMLNEENFAKLKGSEQIALIRLGIEYAFGKPEAPIKRSIVANVGDNVDAVFSSMAKLASKAELPEYKGVIEAQIVEEQADLDDDEVDED
jgi:hypothetical protein